MARVTALLAELEAKLKTIRPTLTFALGARELSALGSPPRIIWVPTNVRHGAPEKRTTNPRPLFTRKPNIVAHIWGADYDATEDMVHDLIAALHGSAWGSLEILGEEWVQPDTVSEGHVALVTFAPSVPVNRRTFQQIKLTDIEPDTTGAAQGDGTIEWDEP